MKYLVVYSQQYPAAQKFSTVELDIKIMQGFPQYGFVDCKIGCVNKYLYAERNITCIDVLLWEHSKEQKQV